jgi:3-hydroxyisobutyrate dehydrogenase-like beta-hydroxyacid dehydrogenase
MGETALVKVGLLHPGEMGAAIGAVLRARNHEVLWASRDRSGSTAERAEQAGLRDVGDVEDLRRRCDVLISVCPPHAAVDVARSAAGFAGIYLDANAVSPQTTREIGTLLDRFVDGGIVGPPPRESGMTRLYLAGVDAPQLTELFSGTIVDARVVADEPGAASALKMSYASWTKGSSALLLAARALAQAEGVAEALLEEWQLSLPDLPERSVTASRSALRKGWRWVGEMNEIADSYASAGLPDGFHRAAAEIYRRASLEPDCEATIERMLTGIRNRGGSPA